MRTTSAKIFIAVILSLCSVAVAARPVSADNDRKLHEAANRAVQLIERT